MKNSELVELYGQCLKHAMERKKMELGPHVAPAALKIEAMGIATVMYIEERLKITVDETVVIGETKETNDVKATSEKRSSSPSTKRSR